MEFNELVTDIILKDAELKNALRAKIVKALDEVDIKDELQKTVEDLFENYDFSDSLGEIIDKALQRYLNEKLGLAKPKARQS